jgi:hypothetical protein
MKYGPDFGKTLLVKKGRKKQAVDVINEVMTKTDLDCGGVITGILYERA